MIWLILVAVIFVAGGTWLVAKTTQTRLVVAALGVAGAATYWFIGHPSMSDRPLDVRLAEVRAQMQTSPEQLDPRGVIAAVEAEARSRPNDPMGHFLIGRQYEALAQDAQQRGMELVQSGNEAAAGEQAALMQDSLTKAEQAYSESLRRNPNNPEAIAALADLRFKTTGEVDERTTRLYQAAFQASPDRFRYGYLAGIGLWQQGKSTEAEALWADIDKRAPADGPERQMFAALRQMFGIDQPTTP